MNESFKFFPLLIARVGCGSEVVPKIVIFFAALNRCTVKLRIFWRGVKSHGQIPYKMDRQAKIQFSKVNNFFFALDNWIYSRCEPHTGPLSLLKVDEKFFWHRDWDHFHAITSFLELYIFARIAFYSSWHQGRSMDTNLEKLYRVITKESGTTLAFRHHFQHQWRENRENLEFSIFNFGNITKYCNLILL